jgi:hypothetical protein
MKLESACVIETWHFHSEEKITNKKTQLLPSTDKMSVHFFTRQTFSSIQVTSKFKPNFFICIIAWEQKTRDYTDLWKKILKTDEYFIICQLSKRILLFGLNAWALLLVTYIILNMEILKRNKLSNHPSKANSYF